MQAKLPQQAKPDEKREREALLEEARELYRYDHEAVPGIAIGGGELPEEEVFSEGYFEEVYESLKKVWSNMQALRFPEVPKMEAVDVAFEALGAFLEGGKEGFFKEFERIVSGERLPAVHADRLEDYRELYPMLGLPPAAARMGRWGELPRRRLAGANPMVIRRLRAFPEGLDLEGHPIEERARRALGEGTLYACDYAALDEMELGTVGGVAKYMTAPIALFVQKGRALDPLAIQLGQGGGELVTPQEEEWRWARRAVECADAIHHEAVSHLAYTHLTVEPFVIATRRQLAPEHPIHQLLAPHLRFTMAINELAVRVLVAAEGPIDRNFAATIESTLELASWAASGPLVDRALRTELAARGMLDAPIDFPYRDDALLVHDAIAAYVGRYLALYYRRPEDLAGDAELSAWLREVGDERGGKVRGLPPALSREGLTALLTQLIFTASAQHAAVNFPQFPMMGYPPVSAFALYTPPPGSALTGPRDELLSLPPLNHAVVQVNLLYLLSSFRWDRLGEREEFDDPAAEQARVAFRADLVGVEAEIEDREEGGERAYPYLRPSLIPNSISI